MADSKIFRGCTNFFSLLYMRFQMTVQKYFRSHQLVFLFYIWDFKCRLKNILGHTNFYFSSIYEISNAGWKTFSGRTNFFCSLLYMRFQMPVEKYFRVAPTCISLLYMRFQMPVEKHFGSHQLLFLFYIWDFKCRLKNILGCTNFFKNVCLFV